MHGSTDGIHVGRLIQVRSQSRLVEGWHVREARVGHDAAGVGTRYRPLHRMVHPSGKTWERGQGDTEQSGRSGGCAKRPLTLGSLPSGTADETSSVA